MVWLRSRFITSKRRPADETERLKENGSGADPLRMDRVTPRKDQRRLAFDLPFVETSIE